MRHTFLDTPRVQAALLGVVCLMIFVLTYLILIRPFSSGLDLANFIQSQGPEQRVRDLVTDAEIVETAITDLRLLVLAGPEAGSTLSLARAVQVRDEATPRLEALQFSSPTQGEASLGSAQLAADGQTLTLDGDVEISRTGDQFAAPYALVNEMEGWVSTTGATQIAIDGLSVQSDSGTRIWQDGTIELGN